LKCRHCNHKNIPDDYWLQKANYYCCLSAFFLHVCINHWFHIAHSCNRECVHPLEAWQSKLTSLWFFWPFLKQKKGKKGKTQRPENKYSTCASFVHRSMVWVYIGYFGDISIWQIDDTFRNHDPSPIFCLYYYAHCFLFDFVISKPEKVKWCAMDLGSCLPFSV